LIIDAISPYLFAFRVFCVTIATRDPDAVHPASSADARDAMALSAVKKQEKRAMADQHERADGSYSN
jgi:hypothetical protein